MLVRRQSPVATWPFWLLIAAWFCANVPSTAPWHAFTWVKEAGHFSHQGDLRESVASLLTGSTDLATPQFSAAPVPTPDSLPPALPAGPSLKKVDLALATGSLRLIASLPPEARPESEFRAPVAPVAEVPCPPPRGTALA